MSQIVRTISVLAIAFSFLLSSTSYAAMADYKILKEKSSMKFFAINNGAPVEGEFKEFSAIIKFDPDKPEDSKIVGEVNTGSVSASYDEVAKSLVSKDWLSSVEFPRAIFTSEKLSRMPNSDNYYADGKLELRGKTMPAVLNFQLQSLGDKNVIAKGFITIRRNEFGVGQGDWAKDDVVKNEVRVEFRIAAEKQ